MELLVINLIKPISISTWNGYLYVLVVVEVSCHYTVSHLLKDKKDVIIHMRTNIFLFLLSIFLDFIFLFF